MRKKTALARKQRKEEYRRWNIEVWFPTADDLPLLDVPEDARPQLRKRLAQWLPKMRHLMGYEGENQRLGIRGGKCWEVAQSFVMAAKDPNVTLVEGVWIRPWELDEGEQPAPHTWAMVDGYRVDLIGEFYSWRGDSEWLYEPLAEYTYADLSRLFGTGPEDEGIMAEGFDISSIMWWKHHGDDESFLPEHLRNDREPNPKDFGQPSGDYSTNRREFEMWLQSERHSNWQYAFRAYSDERNRFISNIVFEPAIKRLSTQISWSRRRKDEEKVDSTHQLRQIGPR